MYSEFGMAVIKMFLALAVIVALIIAFSHILKRLRTGVGARSSSPVMRTLGHMSIAPKRAVTLIEVCGQYFLLGVGSENISLISKMDIPSDDGPFSGVSQQNESRFQSILERVGVAGPKREKGR